MTDKRFVQLIQGGHVFKADKYDPQEVDAWAGADEGYHNGPWCEPCYEGWCHHCTEGLYEEQCPSLDDDNALIGLDEIDSDNIYRKWRQE